ncbi:MarR family winged helix-turn-helix transcriptional regulator [Pseudovibrio sp. SPO723]|uniref:MarR family winged helix-turn-helix transcriptional regulator n=1 Tax=Nesiotobacter zosterae TaxID=392721 RepID=UPI0029C3880A|nr:MarR family transcriptional regulator [Pseudovibrio sp. SPO723]MDX5593868.1 MarR family transcriptional regulator [Pseudovibrio sp. SPO723]
MRENHVAGQSLDQQKLKHERLRLWSGLSRASARIEAELRERMRIHFAGVTLPRYDVLAALYEEPEGLLMSQLSRSLMVSNGNVTGIVERLVSNGLAERRSRDGDKRTHLVRLTAEGRRSYEIISAHYECWVDELLGCFDGAETEFLNKTLRSIS